MPCKVDAKADGLGTAEAEAPARTDLETLETVLGRAEELPKDEVGGRLAAARTAEVVMPGLPTTALLELLETVTEVGRSDEDNAAVW